MNSIKEQLSTIENKSRGAGKTTEFKRWCYHLQESVDKKHYRTSDNTVYIKTETGQLIKAPEMPALSKKERAKIKKHIRKQIAEGRIK